MEGDLQRRVGDNLRAHREARGLSQEAFAEVFWFGGKYEGSIERGERNLSLRSVEQLAEAIGVDAASLVLDQSNASDATGA